LRASRKKTLALPWFVKNASPGHRVMAQPPVAQPTASQASACKAQHGHCCRGEEARRHALCCLECCCTVSRSRLLLAPCDEKAVVAALDDPESSIPLCQALVQRFALELFVRWQRSQSALFGARLRRVLPDDQFDAMVAQLLVSAGDRSTRRAPAVLEIMRGLLRGSDATWGLLALTASQAGRLGALLDDSPADCDAAFAHLVGPLVVDYWRIGLDTPSGSVLACYYSPFAFTEPPSLVRTCHRVWAERFGRLLAQLPKGTECVVCLERCDTKAFSIECVRCGAYQHLQCAAASVASGSLARCPVCRCTWAEGAAAMAHGDLHEDGGPCRVRGVPVYEVRGRRLGSHVGSIARKMSLTDRYAIDSLPFSRWSLV